MEESIAKLANVTAWVVPADLFSPFLKGPPKGTA